jgi:hypothetical protein
MMTRTKYPQPKHPELDALEVAALRDLANKRAAQSHILGRLREIGLVEENDGTWIPTREGKIQLMFASAK